MCAKRFEDALQLAEVDWFAEIVIHARTAAASLIPFHGRVRVAFVGDDGGGAVELARRAGARARGHGERHEDEGEEGARRRRESREEQQKDRLGSWGPQKRARLSVALSATLRRQGIVSADPPTPA